MRVPEMRGQSRASATPLSRACTRAECGGCLSWSAAARATYYRIFIKIEGEDADFRFLKRDSDLDHTLTGLTPGTTVSVYIIAANPGGEAPPSPTVTKVVGA